MDTINVTADADTLCRRAAAFIDAGRIAVARPLVAAALALGRPSADLTLLDVRIAMAGGAWDQAIRQLDRGIAEAPSHIGLRKCRAEVRQRMGNLEGTARDLAEAVVLDPTDAHAKAMLGSTLLDLGRSADGVACLSEAVSNAPLNPGYREALSSAFERCGDPEAGLAVLIDGIEQTPASISLRNSAILLCMRRRDFSQAVRLAENGRSVGIADATTFGLKGHALSSLGRHDEAAVAYQEALKLGPEDLYVRHLVASSGIIPDLQHAPEDYIRAVFDGYADRFEAHLISLGYRIPGMIRTALQAHPKLKVGLSLGPVLDLGCGTGLVAVAIGDLPVGPFTGIDLSSRMLARARAKQIYQELREANIVADLQTNQERWPLIVAADVLCYFGALDELLSLIHQRLQPRGWGIFSIEELLPDHEGIPPGNGKWALQRQGRYAHTEEYVYETVCDVGFRVLRIDRQVLRQEAGADVPGLLLSVERIRDDD